MPPYAMGVCTSFCKVWDGVGETRSSICGFCEAVGVSWNRRREEGWWKGLLSMLHVLVLVLNDMRTGLSIICDEELEALRKGGDTDACLAAGARDEEAMIGGGDSSVTSLML